MGLSCMALTERVEVNELLSAREFVGSLKTIFCPRRKVGLLSAQTRANGQERGTWPYCVGRSESQWDVTLTLERPQGGQQCIISFSFSPDTYAKS